MACGRGEGDPDQGLDIAALQHAVQAGDAAEARRLIAGAHDGRPGRTVKTAAAAAAAASAAAAQRAKTWAASAAQTAEGSTTSSPARSATTSKRSTPGGRQPVPRNRVKPCRYGPE